MQVLRTGIAENLGGGSRKLEALSVNPRGVVQPKHLTYLTGSEAPDMGKRKELSEAEIWDDSALLRSWDEALEEYKVCAFSTKRKIL